MSTVDSDVVADSATVSDAQRRILNRLKRARGQLNAVIESVESGADCRTVVGQLSAVTGALDKAGFAIISSAMRDCVAAEPDAAASASDPDAEPGSGPLTVAELEKLFLSLA
ncbi:DNA-binding FrmR family transcriptional regulator [Microterricola gilva]|uniref:DNA-binding FrmR family transcriptional regulator n=1 Tax=Microterricola gilva TaxID=393267 RepID=A0A4Q8ANB9_9MICO|nr:metal-sensitive transcriptional regulator [Microterricola gilva]RZU66132.1 DNA-binding FrmR family transcriptional regulator [Microterricola gilva]